MTTPGRYVQHPHGGEVMHNPVYGSVGGPGDGLYEPIDTSQPQPSQRPQRVHATARSGRYEVNPASSDGLRRRQQPEPNLAAAPAPRTAQAAPAPYRDGRDLAPPPALQANTDNADAAREVDIVWNPIGIYGWKKYCLYAVVLLLTCLAIINIGLTVWIIRVLEVDKDGAGPLRFCPDEIRVEGTAEFTQGLVASRLRSFNDSALQIESNRGLVLSAAVDGPSTSSASSLNISSAGMTSVASELQANSATTGSNLFRINDAVMEVNTPEMVIKSSAGLAVRGAVQTDRLVNEGSDGAGLSLESVGQSLSMTAASDVALQSSNADISVRAFSGVSVTAADQISLSGASIRMPGLAAQPDGQPTYTLCACANGRLFRVAQAVTCASATTAVCAD